MSCTCYYCFYMQNTAFEMRISAWSSDVCSSDLRSSYPTSLSRSGVLMRETDELPQWQDYLNSLVKADEVLNLLADHGDAFARQEAHRLLFLSLASGYATAFVDQDYPDFVPIVSSVFNSVDTNSDFIYTHQNKTN